VPIEPGEPVPSAPPTEVRHAVEQEAPPRREGLVSIDEFDTTLYFLEEREIEYLRKEAEREYAQDCGATCSPCCSTCSSCKPTARCRAELIGIVENFIPYLLGAGDFRSVAYILREVRVLLERARELIPEHRQTLAGLPAGCRSRSPRQLLQSLDEASVHPSEEELSETFRELRARRCRP